MPRQARLDIPGALHHIMVRGINKSSVFKETQDKLSFLERLDHNVLHGECTVYAWVLMDNHAHILFKSGRAGIAVVMRKQLTWYAQYYNHRHNRTGHLFENRYKSILCEEENYLLSLVRYIHLNPVRANIVKTLKGLDAYSWSGHRAMIGRVKYPWMDVHAVLSRFGGSIKSGITKYRQFMVDGMGEGQNLALTGGGLLRSQGGWSQVLALRRRGEQASYDERILGGGEFVDQILKETEDRQLRQIRHTRRGKTIHKIMAEECRSLNISPEELQGGGKRQKVTDLRARIARRSREELGLPAAEIARHLGVSTSSIIRAIEREVQRKNQPTQ